MANNLFWLNRVKRNVRTYPQVAGGASLVIRVVVRLVFQPKLAVARSRARASRGRTRRARIPIQLHVHIRPDTLDLFWPRNDVTVVALTEFSWVQRRLR